MTAFGRHFLNGQDVYATWGIAVTENKIAFLQKGKRKQTFENNWVDNNGTDVDLSFATFEDVEIPLRCVLLAQVEGGKNSAAVAMQNLSAFVAEMTKPGWQQWQVNDHNSEVYWVRFVDTNTFSAVSKRIDVPPGTYAVILFTLHIVKTLSPTQDDHFVTLLNPDGSVHIQLPPGSKWRLPDLTPPQPTITINSVTVSGGTVTVSASTSPAGLPIEYSLKGATYQASNTFLDTPAGKYTNVRAKIGGTSISVGWPNVVVVTYIQPIAAPPAPTGPITDNLNKRFGWTNVPGFVNLWDYEFSENYGENWATVTANPQPITPPKAAGEVRVRVKAEASRPVGASLLNTVGFTANPVFNTALISDEESHGVTYIGRPGTVFKFQGPRPFGSPYPVTMEIHLNGDKIGTVYHSPGWEGLPCALQIPQANVEYYFTFKDGDHELI